MSTDKVIMTSAMVTLGSTTAAHIIPDKYGGKGELPGTRLLFGTALTFFGLSVLGDIAPGIAGPLAAAIGFTAITYYGVPIMDNYFVQGTNKNSVGLPDTNNNKKG